MIWMGFYPKPFLDRMEVSLTDLIESVERRSAQRTAPIGFTVPAAAGSAAEADPVPTSE
jgi:hypothetical protein